MKFIYLSLLSLTIFCQNSWALSDNYAVQVECQLTGEEQMCGLTKMQQVECGESRKRDESGNVIAREKQTFWADFKSISTKNVVTKKDDEDLSGDFDRIKGYGASNKILIDVTQLKLQKNCDAQSVASVPCKVIHPSEDGMSMVAVNTGEGACTRVGGGDLSSYKGPKKVCAARIACEDFSGIWEQLISCAPSSDQTCPPIEQCLMNKKLQTKLEKKELLEKKGYLGKKTVEENGRKVSEVYAPVNNAMLITEPNGVDGLCVSFSRGERVIAETLASGQVDEKYFIFSGFGMTTMNPDGTCPNREFMEKDMCVTGDKVSLAPYSSPTSGKSGTKQKVNGAN